MTFTDHKTWAIDHGDSPVGVTSRSPDRGIAELACEAQVSLTD